MVRLLIITNIILLIVSVLVYIIVFRVNLRFLIQPPVCKNCNVILVSIDTLGANHLPCYGYKRNTAPNLCRFAKENVLFTNSFSNAPWTLPSHFSIFTSLYPKHHGMEHPKDSLDEKITTVTEIFKSKGYDTMYVGPLDDPNLPLEKGLGRGFDTIEDSKYRDIATWDKGYKKLIDNAKKGKSTFLFLHTYWVHAPYVVGDLGRKNINYTFTKASIPEIPLMVKNVNKFTQGFYEYMLQNGDEEIVDALKQTTDLSQAEKKFKSLMNERKGVKNIFFGDYYLETLAKSDSTVLYGRDLYDELIYYLDNSIARLFSLLSKKELANNTVLIITSDHGEEFMEHGNVAHPGNDLFNTLTATPLIMYIPGIKERNIPQLVQSIDVAPTMLNLVGIDKPTTFEGIDLTGLIQKRDNAKTNTYLISNGIGIDSIRDSKLKLYVSYPGFKNSEKMKLFDLQKDPSEQHNVISENKQAAQKLLNALEMIIYKRKLQ